MKNLWLNIVVIIAALSITACGPAPHNEPPVVSTASAFDAATSSQTVKPDSPTPTPAPIFSPTLAAGTVSAGSVPAAGVVVPPSTPLVVTVAPPEQMMGIQVFSDFEGSNFFPRIRAFFCKPDGTPVADDFISEDGWGLSRNYKKIVPGEYYRLSLSAPEMANPYFSKITKFTGHVMPRFFFGSVKFQITKELNALINNGINVKINKQPEGLLLYDGLFKDMKGVSIYGDTFLHMLILEAGNYTYTVYDSNKKDKLIICDENGDEATMAVDSCDFTISRETPSIIIDLSSYVGIKKEEQKRVVQ